VLAGRVVAGPIVRDGCRRHIRDLADGAARGLRFDRAAADRAIAYYRDVLRLNGGDYEGKPFALLPWQEFVVGSLFGWLGSDGTRRFRVAYIEAGKGCGKSPLVAGIGLYGLTADAEARAEIYAAAAKKDQAMILFRDAVAMVKQSPALTARSVLSGGAGAEWNIAWHQSASFFRPIASDEAQSGPRPHIALLDEIHEHRTGTVVEMMRAGTKGRRQALIVMITNSGADRQSVCWEYHEYARKVCAGTLQDDSFFGYVCALDDADKPFEDESCWAKANPSLPYGLPGLKYLREQVREARGLPSKESVVRRLNFCQWVDAAAPWLTHDVWKNSADPVPLEAMRGRRCWAGLDLGATQDLTALALRFEPTDDDPIWRLHTVFWLPGDNLREKSEQDRVPYTAWRDAGFIEALPGRAISIRAVLARVAEACRQFDVVKVAYDRWGMAALRQLAQEEGITLPLAEFGQGYKDMAPAVNEFERQLLNAELRHDANPVLGWCASNAVLVSDPAGNRKLAKDRATGRIDGIVAHVMACGAALAEREPPKTYQMLFL
jgi:phage terminase large subunit-like protein